MANVLDDDEETLDFADESEYAGHAPYDCPASWKPGETPPKVKALADPVPVDTYEDDLTVTLRHIAEVTCDGEDSSIRLACRTVNGHKVWLTVEGLSLGMILDAVLVQMGKSRG